jgi:hypothetical protein
MHFGVLRKTAADHCLSEHGCESSGNLQLIDTAQTENKKFG